MDRCRSTIGAVRPWSASVAVLAFFYFTPSSEVHAFANRPSLIPNGVAFSCSCCHVAGRTPFAKDIIVLLTGVGGGENGITSRIEAEFWGPELAALDSDGDGRTNGEELGDPEGLWKPGDDPPDVVPTNPGVHDCDSDPPPDPDEPCHVECVSLGLTVSHDFDTGIRAGRVGLSAVGIPRDKTAVYRFRAEREDGRALHIGPQEDRTAFFDRLGPGLWTLTLVAEITCDGATRSATRSTSIPIAGEPDIGPFLRGDHNSDDLLDIADGIAVVGFLFLGSAESGCRATSDANADGVVDVADAIFVFNFLFLGGAAPGAYPACDPGMSENDRAFGCGDPSENCG